MKTPKNVITDEEFAALKVKYPRGVVVVPTVAGDAAFQCPPREQFRDCVKDLGTPRANDGMDYLMRKCVVAPSATDFDAMLERKPAISTPCINALFELAGVDKAPQVVTRDHETFDEVIEVSYPGGVLTLRGPTRIENKQYEDESDEPSKKAAAQERYVTSCMVSPVPRDFGALLDLRPGLAMTCFNPLRKLAGVEVTAHVKK